MSVLRVLIGVGGAALLAIPIHQFSIFDALGPALLAFFVNLLWFSWAMGLMIAALVLRLGLGAEPGLGADLPDPAAVRRVLPDRDPAGVAAAGLLVPALGAGVRGHARRSCSSTRLRADLLLHAVLLNLVWMASRSSSS